MLWVSGGQGSGMLGWGWGMRASNGTLPVANSRVNVMLKELTF